MVALVAFVVGISAGSPGSPEKDAAGRFAAAWAAKNFKAMYAELNEASRARESRRDFEAAYREAQETATVRGIDAGSAADSQSTGGAKVVPVAMTIQTVAFGTVEEDLDVTYADGGIEWDVYQDAADHTRYVETFLAESWTEHLRQHQRVTKADREIERRIRSFCIEGQRGRVLHLLHVRSPEKKG